MPVTLGSSGITFSNGTTQTTAATGTVTSVTVSPGSGLSGGGTVTSSGTVTLTNAGVTSLTAGSGISVSASTGGVTITNTSAGSMTEITSGVSTSPAPTAYSVSLNFSTYRYYTIICTAGDQASDVIINSIRFNSDSGSRYGSFTWTNGTANNQTNWTSMSGITLTSNGGSAFIDIYTRSGSALGGANISGAGSSKASNIACYGGYSPNPSAAITSIQFNASGYWIIYGVK